MKKTIEMTSVLHEWDKVNSTTIMKGGKSYDIMKCSLCDITGKRFGITSTLVLDGRTSQKKISFCNNKLDPFMGREITIGRLNTGIRGPFENMTEGSVHTVINPPEEHKHMTNGKDVWVMGNGEPVRILSHEFEFSQE